MGFKSPDVQKARDVIGRSVGEICSPYNDGWTASACKQELYMLKCWLDQVYEELPTFVGEEKWEQERLINLLKQK
jgi:hypothetical protein